MPQREIHPSVAILDDIIDARQAIVTNAPNRTELVDRLDDRVSAMERIPGITESSIAHRNSIEWCPTLGISWYAIEASAKYVHLRFREGPDPDDETTNVCSLTPDMALAVALKLTHWANTILQERGRTPEKTV